MQEQKTETLTTVLSEVLANLAFMFSDEDQAEAAPGDIWLETTIGYRGPISGDLVFRCSREFSTHLAANLLGIDPDEVDTESKADDAVKEFMNIVCGQLITALHGTEFVFNLTIPEIRVLAEMPDLTGPYLQDSSTLSVEGRLVQLAYAPAQPE